MPTYEYACPTCGIVEVFQSIKDDALKKCPTCKKQKVTRMVSSGVGIIFKGSGFWETDYNRTKDYKTKSEEAKGTPATPAAAPTPPTEPQAKPQLKKSEAPPASPAPASPKT